MTVKGSPSSCFRAQKPHPTAVRTGKPFTPSAHFFHGISGAVMYAVGRSDMIARSEAIVLTGEVTRPTRPAR